MSRPRLDAHWHKLAGSEKDAKRDRSKKPEESAVTAGRPKMPAEFKDDAHVLERGFWKAACSLLAAKGTLSKTDAPTLRLFADISARQVEANADIKAKGLVYDEQRFSKGGDPYTVRVTNPNVKIVTDCERQLLQLQKELGLSSASREKVRRAKPNLADVPPVPGSALARRPDLFGLRVVRKKEEEEEEEQEQEEIESPTAEAGDIADNNAQ
jgi:P27 family predicted phage terminase small subunit